MANNDDLNYFITSLIGSLTAFSLYKVFSSQNKVFKHKKTLQNITKTPIKSADDAFHSGQTVIVKGTVGRNSKDNRNDLIVRENSSGKKQQFIVFLKYRETIYSNQNFTNKEQYVFRLKDVLGRADITISPSFLINGLKQSITVSGYDQADYSHMLEILRWDNKKRRLNLTQKFEVLMLSYFRALGTLVITDRGRPGYLRGIDVGTREVQTGLKVGASILALGTIGVSVNGQILLEPNLLFKDRLSVIANLNDVMKGYEESRNFWFVVLLLGSIYVGRRIYKYQKKNDFVRKIKDWWNGKRQQKTIARI